MGNRVHAIHGTIAELWKDLGRIGPKGERIWANVVTLVGAIKVGSISAGTNNIGRVDIEASLPAGDNNIGNVDLASALPAGANNIGDVDVLTVAPPPTLYTGVTTVAVATTRVVLGAAQALLAGVEVKAAAANQGTVYVGNATVAAANGYRLLADERVFIAVDNVADVWLDASINAQVATWLAS